MDICPMIIEGWLTGQTDAIRVLCDDLASTSFDYLMIRARFQLSLEGISMDPFPHPWAFGYQSGYRTMFQDLDRMIDMFDEPTWFNG